MRCFTNWLARLKLESNLKIIIVLICLITSFNSVACFVQPEGLTEQHETQLIDYLIFAGVLMTAALFIRASYNIQKIWVPILLLVIFGYFPMYLYMLEIAGVSPYSGSCGAPGFVYIGKVLAIGMACIFALEVVLFFKGRGSRKVK
jgi:hypothetical protein